MKDVNLLPDWYKQKRRLKISRRSQYAALVVMMALLFVWNMVITDSYVDMTDHVLDIEKKVAASTQVDAEFDKMKQNIIKLQSQKETWKKIRRYFSVSAVIAEIGSLTDDKILIDKIECLRYKIKESKQTQNATRTTDADDSKQMPGIGQVTFQIAISGITETGADLARFVQNVEMSQYFNRTYPKYTKKKTVQLSDHKGRGEYNVHGFEVVCYLDNYEVREGK